MGFTESGRRILERDLSQNNPRVERRYREIERILALREEAETRLRSAPLQMTEEEKGTLSLSPKELAKLKVEFQWLNYRLGLIDTEQRTQNINNILNNLDEETLRVLLAVDEQGRSILAEIRDKVMTY